MVRSYRKLFVVLLLSAAFIAVPLLSRAFVPVVAIAGYLLEVTGGSLLVTDLVAGMSGTVAGVLWWECNKFGSGGCDSKPSSMPASQAPGSPTLTVYLNPDAKRDNPDSSKFDDPAGSARDVTPKTTVAPTLTRGDGPASYPPDMVPYGSDATMMAPDGQVFQHVDGAGNTILGKDSSSVGYQVWKSMGPPCGGMNIKCVIRPWGPIDGGSGRSCMVFDIRGGDYGETNMGSFNVCTSSGSTSCPSGSASSGGSCVQVTTAQATPSCGAGYMLNGSDCLLTDPSQVKKPDDAPCELLWDTASGSLMTDPSAPKCSGIANSPSLTAQNPDGSSMTVTPNSNGGFDITKTNANGSSTTVKTGPYQPSIGGYVIIQTLQVTPAGQTPDGQGDGCGIPGKPACNVQFNTDAATEVAGQATQQGVTDGMNRLKGMLDNIDPNKFQWSFIPQIPTAQCENPRVKNPLITQYLDVDICGWFNKFSFFLKGVLAVLCMYGCAHEVQKAMRA